MVRSLLLAGLLSAAIPAAVAAQPMAAPSDTSNPAAAPLSPSQDRANQPARGEDSRVVREAEAERAAGTAPADLETEADRRAREEAAKPKLSRTVRMGERTIATASVMRR